MWMMIRIEQMMMRIGFEQMACGVSLAAEAGTQLSALQLHWPAACYYTGIVMVMRRRGRRSLLLYWDCDDDDPKTHSGEKLNSQRFSFSLLACCYTLLGL